MLVYYYYYHFPQVLNKGMSTRRNVGLWCARHYRDTHNTIDRHSVNMANHLSPLTGIYTHSLSQRNFILTFFFSYSKNKKCIWITHIHVSLASFQDWVHTHTRKLHTHTPRHTRTLMNNKLLQQRRWPHLLFLLFKWIGPYLHSCNTNMEERTL